MTERHDRPTVDIEEVLVRYMVEQRLSRRDHWTTDEAF